MFARRAFPGLSLLIGLAACAPKTEQQAAAAPVVDSAAVQSATAAFWQKWAAAEIAADSATLSAMVGDSARLDVRGLPPLLGRTAYAAAMTPMMKAMKVVSDVITPEMTTAISNELSYGTGNFTEQTLAGGKAATDYGRFAAALHKGADGQWRIAYVMVFSDSTVPAKP